MENTLGPDNAIWDDGEWVSWDEINQQIQYKEWRARYPNADLSLVSVFESLIGTAGNTTISPADTCKYMAILANCMVRSPMALSCTAITPKGPMVVLAMTSLR